MPYIYVFIGFKVKLLTLDENIYLCLIIFIKVLAIIGILSMVSTSFQKGETRMCEFHTSCYIKLLFTILPIEPRSASVRLPFRVTFYFHANTKQVIMVCCPGLKVVSLDVRNVC